MFNFLSSPIIIITRALDQDAYKEHKGIRKPFLTYTGPWSLYDNGAMTMMLGDY